MERIRETIALARIARVTNLFKPPKTETRVVGLNEYKQEALHLLGMAEAMDRQDEIIHAFEAGLPVSSLVGR